MYGMLCCANIFHNFVVNDFLWERKTKEVGIFDYMLSYATFIKNISRVERMG